MRMLSRGALVLASAVLALGAGVGAAGTAAADGPDTDPRVAAAIDSQPWLELGPGDSDYRIATARCYLVQFGYYDDCEPSSAGEGWPPDLGDALQEYQEAHDLPESGELDIETWDALQDDGGEIGQGSGLRDQIRGIQYAMKVLQDPELAVDGYYGPATSAAVMAFQERKQIDADGIFGPITFRAALAQGAEEKSTPGLL